MHAIAECGMFYLQAAVAQQPGASWTAQRQGQAVDNIAVVLDAMGERGREGPLSEFKNSYYRIIAHDQVVFPIAVVSNWQDHVRSTSIVPTSQQLQLDEHLAIWWAEARQQWGVERDRAVERGYQPLHASPPTHPHHPGADRHSRSTTYGETHGHYHDPRDRHPEYDHIYQQPQRHQPLLGRNARPDHQERRESAAGQYRLQHILDSAPTVQIDPHSISSSNFGLGLYSNGGGAGPTSRHSMSSATPGNGRGPSSPRSHQFINPYVRDHPYGQKSNPSHTSPPDLINTNSTSASLLLPTPSSSRPNLLPLPTHGARPRAVSSVVPYSVTRESSPISSGDQQAGTSGRSRQHMSRLSLSDKALDGAEARESEVSTSGYYLPPSAELRHLRQLEEIPRSVARSSLGMGISLGSGRGWAVDPFSPAHAEKEKGRPATPTEGEEPLGIAALISAAESERVKEEKRRESDGSMDSRGKEEVVAMKEKEMTGAGNKDAEVREEREEASLLQQAVVA